KVLLSGITGCHGRYLLFLVHRIILSPIPLQAIHKESLHRRPLPVSPLTFDVSQIISPLPIT
ncbi:MAG TPA: hypothetical protein VGN63_04200, partial [Flavisolibacter sp.]|nr:hypothetical protein [Flavisolibacter sp.]